MKVAVVIGRFQPFHNGHIHLVRTAIEQSDVTLVLVGSSNIPRTIKNPFTFEERRDMIRATFPRKSLIIDFLNDHTYDDIAWIEEVQTTVDSWKATLEDENDEDVEITLCGHIKDSSSSYLKMFPQWKFVEVGYDEILPGLEARLDATQMRINMFEGRLSYCLGVVPHATLTIMRSFMDTQTYQDLKEEYDFIQAYRDSWSHSPYPPVFVTTDVVVVQSGHVLLVKRGQNPGKGLLALPGGFLDQVETLESCAIRELREETNIHLQEDTLRRCITHVKVFDRSGGVSQEDRGRIVTHVHLIRLDDSKPLPKVKGGDDAAEALWVPVSDLSRHQFFSDHYDILTSMLKLA